MKVFHSVRTRIILISACLLLFFIIVYTLTVWTVANSYALVNTGQNNSFSLSLLYEEIENNLDNVKALVTRVSIDNELKNYLKYNEADLDSYYDSFESMILSSPAYSVIDRFIVSDHTYSRFLQTGGTALSSGRALRQDYFLNEISHIESEMNFSGIFFSDLAYRSYQVIGILMPIIDYNSALTIGYVYASVNIDHLLDNLYSYQAMNDAELYVSFSGTNYKVDDRKLTAVSSMPEPVELETPESRVWPPQSARNVSCHTAHSACISHRSGRASDSTYSLCISEPGNIQSGEKTCKADREDTAQRFLTG